MSASFFIGLFTFLFTIYYRQRWKASFRVPVTRCKIMQLRECRFFSLHPAPPLITFPHPKKARARSNPSGERLAFSIHGRACPSVRPICSPKKARARSNPSGSRSAFPMTFRTGLHTLNEAYQREQIQATACLTASIRQLVTVTASEVLLITRPVELR